MSNRRREVGRFRAYQESGVALILVLLVMLVLTLLSAALVFTARSETIASTNYALDTQADYVAKAGIDAALNWFRSTHYSAVPGTVAGAGTDYNVTSDGGPWSLYTSNTNPVLCKANCATLNSRVQLIGYGSGSSNFPSGITNGSGTAIATAFASDLNNSGNGVRVTGDSTHSGLFHVNAYLLYYETVYCPSCAVNPAPMETWLITSKGEWTGKSSQTGAIATAEEQAIIQPIYSPSFGNALYGYCSVTMVGSAGTCTDAYNSALGQYGGGNASVASGACDSSTTNVLGAGANIGANGYVSMTSNPTVYGNVVIGNANPSLVPSSCCTGPACGGPTAGNIIGSVILHAPYVTAPAVPTFPGSGQSGATFPGTAPSFTNGTIPQVSSSDNTSPSPGPPPVTIAPGNSTYSYPCITGQTCNGSKSNPYLVSVLSPSNGGGSVTLYGGANPASPVYYDIDNLNFQGTASITINGYVVLNVKSTLDIEGNGILNGLSIKPEQCQINFAGTSAKVAGNGDVSATITAPLATMTLGGGGAHGAFFGAIQAANISDGGGFPVHYDVQLSRLNGSVGQTEVSSYTRIKQ